MTSKYYKGKCTQCGVDLYDYDQNYSDGHMTLCNSCFDEYSKGHHVIVKHCPGCVDNGNDDTFYEWKGLDRFIEENPLKEGWEYKYSWNGPKHALIMTDCNIKREWWVEWHVRDKEIIDELVEKLPKWEYRKET